MSGYLLDWASLLLRWLHVVTGVAWIGSSFYFLWLDNQLPPAQQPQGDPRAAWQAGGTWLSGVGLLGLLYVFQADAYLIGIGILIGSWLLYEGLCRSQFGRSSVKLGAALALLGCALAWALCQLFSGRTAFILFGAVLGTLMVANVLFVIVPAQRGRVRAAELRSRQRASHNSYFTLPVLFVMISHHYPMTYNAQDDWLVLIALSFSGVCIRAWFVARHTAQGRQGITTLMPLVMGLLALIIVIIGLYP